MRGKAAKTLRRLAECMTVDKPKVAYEAYQNPVYQYPTPLTAPGSYLKVVPGVPLKMKKGCTREMYKLLKRSRRKNYVK